MEGLQVKEITPKPPQRHQHERNVSELSEIYSEDHPDNLDDSNEVANLGRLKTPSKSNSYDQGSKSNGSQSQLNHHINNQGSGGRLMTKHLERASPIVDIVDNLAARFTGSMRSSGHGKSTPRGSASQNSQTDNRSPNNPPTNVDDMFANAKLSAFQHSHMSSLTAPDEEYYGDSDGENFIDTTNEEDDEIELKNNEAFVDVNVDAGVEVNLGAGGGKDIYVEESYEGNFKSAYLGESEKDSPPQVARMNRTRSHDSNDKYDNREFHMKGKNLVPVRYQDEESLSPPPNRHRARASFKSAMCLPDVENVKRQTRRGLQYIKNKGQRHHNQYRARNNAGKKSKKKNRNKGSSNDLSAFSGNTDDFSLRNHSYKRRQSKGRGNTKNSSTYGKVSEMDIMSDMSDNDPQDERNDRFMSPMLSTPFAHHIPRAVEVVLNVGRTVSNGYGQVAQIMEAHTSSNSFERITPYSMDEELEMEPSIDMAISPSSSMDRGVSELTLERHCPNFSRDGDEDGVSSVTLPQDQSYKDFIKKGVKILKEQSGPGIQINDSTDEYPTVSRGLSSGSFASDPPLVQPQFTRPGILTPPPPRQEGDPQFRHESVAPLISVMDRVKAYEVQSELEEKIASGVQGPSTPRSRPSRDLSKLRMGVARRGPPPQAFAKLQPTKHNDTLKVLFMSSPHCEGDKTDLVHKLSKQRKKKLSKENTVDVNVYNWEPHGGDNDNDDLDRIALGSRRPTRFRLFDLKGGNIENGSHASQFLFFSPNSLYVIVWDMAVNNKVATSDDDAEYESAFERRKREKVKNRAINFDIDENVLYWLDVIDELNFPGSVIMPVVLSSNQLDKEETEYRCNILKKRLLNHRKDALILFDFDKVPVVNLDEEKSLDQFRRTIISLGTDESSVFKNHFKALSPVVVRTEEAISLFKSKEYNVVLFHDLYSEMSKRQGDNFSEESIREALDLLSSIGEIVYFGNDITECSEPQWLKNFIILNPKWIADAIAPVLCHEEISDVRKTFDGTLSSLGECFSSLFVTDSETIEIWEQIDYVYENNKMGSESDIDELLLFLQQVCEHCGIFLPVTIPSGIGHSISYLLPRVASEPSFSPWTFATKNRYKRTICHSWLIKEILPITFMDDITGAVVKELIELFGQNQTPDPRELGPYVTTYVEQIMCYKTAIYVKVVELVRAERPTKTITELYVCLAHANSPNCISSKDMNNTDRKLMVCGKGFEGRFGEKIWKLGYESILNTVSHVVRNRTKGGFLEEIACPECLQAMAPKDVPCWKMDVVASQPGEEKLRCNNHRNVHMVPAQLLRGELPNPEDDDLSIFSSATGYTACTAWSSISHSTAMTYATYDTYDKSPGKTIPEMLPSVVLVSLWDTALQQIISTGSGFICDKRRGLIVTAGHVFYEFENNKPVGEKFFGIEGAIAIVGIYDKETETASFRYTADILVHDLEKADCAILRLKEKFEHPISTNGCHIPYPQAMTFKLHLPSENLSHLPLTASVELETNVRVIGYNQEGEGLRTDEGNVTIDRSPCYDTGHVLKKMESTGSLDKQAERNRNEPIVHNPQGEIVIKSRAKFGHSGGPCVNLNGEVIGIISRSDPVEEDRNYLAPSTIIMSLYKKAKNKVDARANRQNHRVRFNTATTSNRSLATAIR